MLSVPRSAISVRSTREATKLDLPNRGNANTIDFPVVPWSGTLRGSTALHYTLLLAGLFDKREEMITHPTESWPTVRRSSLLRQPRWPAETKSTSSMSSRPVRLSSCSSTMAFVISLCGNGSLADALKRHSLLRGAHSKSRLKTRIYSSCIELPGRGGLSFRRVSKVSGKQAGMAETVSK